MTGVGSHQVQSALGRNPGARRARLVLAGFIVISSVLAALAFLRSGVPDSSDPTASVVGSPHTPEVSNPIESSRIADNERSASIPGRAENQNHDIAPNESVGEIERLAAELEALIAKRERRAEPYEVIIKRLCEIGAPKAIDVVIGTLMHPDVAFDEEARVFHSALISLDDARIGPYAQRALARVLDRGEITTPNIRGYATLAIKKGGREGERCVAGALLEQRSRRSGAALALAASVCDIRDQSIIVAISETMGRDEQIVLDKVLVRALEGSPNALAANELAAIAFRDGVSSEVRRAAYLSYGRRASPSEIDYLFSPPRYAGSPQERVVILKGALGLAANPSVTKPQFWEKASGFLAESLHSDDSTVRAATIGVLLDLPTDPSRRMLMELELQLAVSEESQEREALAKAIALYK